MRSTLRLEFVTKGKNMVSLARAYHLDIPEQGVYTVTAEQLKQLVQSFEQEKGSQFAGVIKAVLVFGGNYEK